MKKNSTGLLVGAIFLVIGILYAGSAFDLFDFSIFFPGFWTLFIIVPCFYGLFKKGQDKTGYVIGLVIGFCFLINAQDLSFHISLWPLILALLCVVIGVRLIFPNNKRRVQVKWEETEQTTTDMTRNFSEQRNGYVKASALLSGKEIRLDHEVFHGAELSAVLGGIDLDLRNAVIDEDVHIYVDVILGGIDIFTPSYARVIVSQVNPVLGGVGVKRPEIQYPDAGTPTIYIEGSCVLGGVDIK